MSRRTGWIVLLLLAVLGYAASGVYFVRPDEQVVVRRCGAVLSIPSGPGAHWGLPWGIDRRTRLKPGEVKRVSIGRLVNAQTALGDPAPQFLTADRNLVNIRATVHYTIADPALYLFHVADIDSVIARGAEAALTDSLARIGVDAALTQGKLELGIESARQLQQLCDRYQLGILVRSVDVANVEPPPDVADAFADVISALREREQQIHEAEAFAHQEVAQAHASAQRIRDAARGENDRLVREAEGETARFAQLQLQYERAPELTSKRLYLEAMEEILPRFRSKLIIDGQTPVDISLLRENKP